MEEETEPRKSHCAVGAVWGLMHSELGLLEVPQPCLDHSHRSWLEARAGLSQKRVSACKIPSRDTQEGSWSGLAASPEHCCTGQFLRALPVPRT